MPKESVFGPSSLAISDAPINRLDVAWGHDTEVHVGILKDAAMDSAAPFDDGFWLTLDRQQINRLIVTLRKARDQAYGVDQ